ncbi:hypothetical protein [Halarchaeum nitratireducens]|uniref:Uncharacterized protein n=1 Tax=Halarchaeum nitratireducens TaxID=489913 RepID=A0A830G8Z0_9EURY|nr:hypothetical protein [Halarchaeum nitratireducens]GGN09423.1 hypothetical protein GCM10009021_06230 [Halarchaeum nitratireducens]
MISETTFLVLLGVAWVSELGFGALISYWFITQGFGDDAATAATTAPLESRRSVRLSLAAWATFFVVLLAAIVFLN